MIETRFKNTEIGKIPEDWEIIKLGDVVDISSGSTPSRYIESNFTGNICWLTSGELKTHYIYDTKEKISKTAASQLRLYPKGTVVIAMYGLEAEGVRGTCSILNVPATISQACMAFVDFKQIDNEYFYYWYTSNGNLIGTKYAQGTKQQNLSPEIIKSIKIPVPKHNSEQKRVANALSNVDALIAELGKLIEKKRAIKQGAMQQLLTGKKRLKGFTEPWVEKQLDELLQYEQPTKYLVTSTDYSDNGIPVLTAGKTFILGYTNELSGIYNNLPVIIFDDFVTESKYVDFPFKAKSSAMKMLTLRNDINNLRFIFEIMQMIDFPMTDHKRWWIGEYCHIVVKIPSFDEQNAIASFLSSMDEEISALETKRNKYIAIKQGMMQQLLTGKIRLVENVVKTNATSANVHFRRSVLAAEIADRLYDEPTFGHVKMEKMLFLTERLCHIDIGSHYHRDAAGPYDNNALRSIDSQLKKQKWFDMQRTEKGNRYVPMQNRGKHKSYFDRYYSGVVPMFDRIINTFKSQRTEQCEIVATLYSAWEDLLRTQKPFTDADIVNEVLNNWHESKKRISKERWLNAIEWMRDNGFAPYITNV